MDQVTQQNAALVEETSAAADAMRMQAAKLAEAVAVFRTGEAVAAVAKPVAVAPRAVKPALPATTPRAAAKTAAPVRKAQLARTAGDEWEEF